jgi:predicted transglutaminase-like cysteine proteinase
VRTTLYWSAAVTAACMAIAARAPTGDGGFPIRMPSGERADPPRGLTAMCDTQPDQCDSLQRVQARGDTQPAPAGKDKVKLLNTVNRQVNGRVRQETDARAFGQGEIWRRSGTGKNAVGDCEDLALEKMYRLALQGYPSDDLFLAVGYARDVGLHTVLIGRTDQGDLVLDNRTPYLTPWDKAPYSWIVHQEPGALTRWRNVSAQPRTEMVDRSDKRSGKRALARGAATVG